MKQFSPLYVLLLLALSLCGSCTTEAERRQMEQIIAEADSMNRNYVPLTTDSLLLQACRYYDRHGQPNERLRAHYLLGCAYRDMGEAPRAIDAYQEAAACADTLAEDCDFQKLGCVYSQMADVFHRQLLLTHEIEARKKSGRFAILAGDTANSIFEMAILGAAYILQNKKDSAEQTLLDAINLYKAHGLIQEGLRISTILMSLYTEIPDRKDELKQLIDAYETECDLFDTNHELRSINRQYYYYKGRYFEQIGRIDSAEYYYRKVQHPNMGYTILNSMYEGLLSVYQKRNIPDSIAKYAQLYCEVNDSSIAIKDQDLTMQLAASYNYSRFQKEARENESKAHRFLLWVIAITIIFILVLVSGICLGNLYRKQQQRKQEELKRQQQQKQRELEQMKEELANNTIKYEAKQYEMLQLEQAHLAIIASVKKQLSESERKSQEYYGKSLQAQQTIDEINLQYEKEKEELTEEIRSLTERIDSLKRQDGFSEKYEKTRLLAEMGVVKRLRILIDKPQRKMSSTEKEQLESAFSMYYPSLLCDLKQAVGINDTDSLVCLLTALGFRPAHILILTGLSSSQITNAKTRVNTVLFHCHSAQSLLNNIVRRYDIFIG